MLASSLLQMALSDNTAVSDINREIHSQYISNNITRLIWVAISLILEKGLTPACSRRMSKLCVGINVKDLDHCRHKERCYNMATHHDCSGMPLTFSPPAFPSSMPSLMTLRPVRDQGARWWGWFARFWTCPHHSSTWQTGGSTQPSPVPHTHTLVVITWI